MARYKLTLEYDGTGLVGWQRQANGPSVQAALEDAIEAFSGEAATTTAAGRTDAGVHALGQVAHFDLARLRPADTVSDALNAHLRPRPIAVVAAEAVNDDFHARFMATERHYRYRIVNRRGPLTLDRDRAWQVARPLDEAAMQAGADLLVGHHDFTSFRAAECQAASPVKTLDQLRVTRAGDEITIGARARSFLHHQVRNMVGSLVLVGEGKWPPERIASALGARDRTAAGPTAPAKGLYLMSVAYETG
ncbi:MAG: tRNA pseudouridine(38-40) synthase TruA [Alphaproteobacteria bacterium]|jgi:tRNA pseudouridine38-40 synthase|nr:tRNA pseudouridine(38-40) synthase TruA [Alphaproteobacteria bacterium]MDP6515959.1 tRNA pseudouridine(38-40) synthase TruA [Alphaproteobacteria bacterium]